MNHRKLNGLITGVAMVFLSVIVAAIFYGPDSSTDTNDLTPGYVETANDRESSPDGVGGQPAETPATMADETWTQVGFVTDAHTGEPLAGVSVMANDGGLVEITTTTDDDGRFELTDVPSDATLVFSLDGFRTVDQRVAPDREHNVALESRVITGRVVGATGSPVQGATVASGNSITRTVENGLFHLEDAPFGSDIIVKAAGFETKVVSRDEFAQGFVLQPTSIQGVFASAETIADEDRFTELLDMIERTELNALILDIKDSNGLIHYNSSVQLATEIGAVQQTFDVERVLAQLQERGIYAIARINVFEDPALATSRPDLAISDALTGSLWETWQGRAWANPYLSEVQDYNLAIMREAVALGFNEVQLSQVQFPANGPIARAEYGQDSDTASTRQETINGFLDRAYAALGPTTTSLSVDIFAMSLWDEADEQTGQSLIGMTERVDYVLPLLFPSHFAEGSLGLDLPGDHPSAIVGRSIESGRDLIPGYQGRRIRPWLQAFSYGSRMEYGEAEVREQIDAANSFGDSGWLLWNPGSNYPEGALESAEDHAH